MNVPRKAEGGVAIPAVCRTHGISTASFYKWRAKYGEMDASMMSPMKAVTASGVRIALACLAFWGSETCVRYSPSCDEETDRIADLLVGLTTS